MLRKTLFIPIILATIGCGNFSPRVQPKLDQRIDNQQGQIEEIESNQNSIKNEILKLNERLSITDSNLDRIQQGVFNIQDISLFSGSGGLAIAAIFCFSGLLSIIIYYHIQVRKRDQIVDMFANTLVTQSIKNPDITDDLLKAASYTKVESDILRILSNKILKS